jgi:hypothetical protein
MVNPFEFEGIKIEVLNCAVKTATVCRSFRVEIPYKVLETQNCNVALQFCPLCKHLNHIGLMVTSIHFWGVREKLFAPDSFLNPSNSMGLKFGLFSCSHKPPNAESASRLS